MFKPLFFLSYALIILMSFACSNISHTNQDQDQDQDKDIYKDKQLNSEDKEALHLYTAHGYSLLHQDLRNIIWYKDAPIIAGTNLIKPINYKLWIKLNRALKKIPKYQGLVHRGTWERAKLSRDKIRKGQVLIFNSFTSSSTNIEKASRFGTIQLKIQSLHGREISKWSQSPDEAEVLFQAPSYFKVLDSYWHEKGGVIELLELSPKELSKKQKDLAIKQSNQIIFNNHPKYQNKYFLEKSYQQAKQHIKKLKKDLVITDGEKKKLKFFWEEEKKKWESKNN